MFDVENKSIEELHDIEMAIAKRKESVRQAQLSEFNEILDSLKKKAEALNIDLTKLFVKRYNHVYVNPDNPKMVWSGRGPTPKWLEEKLRGLEGEERIEARKQFLIKNSDEYHDQE